MRNRAAFWALLCATTILSACTIWPEHAVSTWHNATGGEGLERSFWRDVKTKDWTELQRHLAGNYLWLAPDGRLDRSAALQYLQQLRLQDYSLADVQTELNGSTFVVSYNLTLHGTSQGQPLSSQPARAMTVWQQQKSGWVAVAHSVIGPASNGAPSPSP
jgi:Domain of unknown function (DUF4440)